MHHQIAGTAGVHHHALLIFVFLVDMGFHHVGQDGLDLLTSSDLPTLASQSAGITRGSHCAQPLWAVGIQPGYTRLKAWLVRAVPEAALSRSAVLLGELAWVVSLV